MIISKKNLIASLSTIKIFQFWETKIKSYGHEVSDFYDKEIMKADSDHACLAVINLDSAFNKYGNYYPKVFLKECKHIKKKVIRHIIDDVECSSDDSDHYDDSDEE